MIRHTTAADDSDERKPTVYDLFGLDADPALTVNAARQQMAPHVLGDGVRCPCCTQLARVYPRPLNSAMAATLIFIVKTARKTGERFVHVGKVGPRFALEGKDFALMVHWGLLEAGDPLDGHPSGWWAATPSGIAFADRQSKVRRQAWIGLGARFFGFKGPEIGIEDALKSKFDYWELIRG